MEHRQREQYFPCHIPLHMPSLKEDTTHVSRTLKIVNRERESEIHSALNKPTPLPETTATTSCHPRKERTEETHSKTDLHDPPETVVYLSHSDALDAPALHTRLAKTIMFTQCCLPSPLPKLPTTTYTYMYIQSGGPHITSLVGFQHCQHKRTAKRRKAKPVHPPNSLVPAFSMAPSPLFQHHRLASTHYFTQPVPLRRSLTACCP